jgi:carbon-monoxide dehydrogenase small subunit
MDERYVELLINGDKYRILVRPNEFLADVLRSRLDLTGTKTACDMGVCGSCTVLLDGLPVSSCLTLAVDAEGKEITTIEGLESADGELHQIQESFLDKGAVQCGFCTAGMVMTTKGFLDKNPHPTEQEIRQALSGNICRCTGYTKIVGAVEDAAKKMHS